jgi:hypothetical protein
MGATAVCTGLLAVGMVGPTNRWSFSLPLLPAAVLSVVLSAGREKSAAGEVAVALAFSLVSVPTSLAAGASLQTALSVGLAFASTFTASTLAVRVVVLKVRGGGSTRAVSATRLLLAGVLGIAIAGLAVASVRHALPWTALVAAAPGLLLAVALAVRPPSPGKLHVVGWTLVSASVAGMVILIGSL